MDFVLGLDSGATKTFCLAAGLDGTVLGSGRAGPSNFQGCGRDAARVELGKAIDGAIRSAGLDPAGARAAFYGVAGADRPKDFHTIREILGPVNPAERWEMENDTMAALRAGTSDGFGIGLISGTGTNAIGRNRKGERRRVGGLGGCFGDFGCGQDLVEEGIACAMRFSEGRGPETVLYEKFINAYDVERLEDLVEVFYFDSFRAFDLGNQAPLLFEAADEGDAVAIAILRKAGSSLASAANSLLHSLFRPDEEVPIVMGGSILQKPTNTTIIDTLQAGLDRTYSGARLVRLSLEPVLGALFTALDLQFGAAPEAAVARAIDTYSELLEPEAS